MSLEDFLFKLTYNKEKSAKYAASLHDKGINNENDLKLCDESLLSLCIPNKLHFSLVLRGIKLNINQPVLKPSKKPAEKSKDPKDRRKEKRREQKENRKYIKIREAEIQTQQSKEKSEKKPVKKQKREIPDSPRVNVPSRLRRLNIEESFACSGKFMEQLENPPLQVY
jgi:hypothetical protein